MGTRIQLDPAELVDASRELTHSEALYGDNAKRLATPRPVVMDPGVWARVEAGLVGIAARLMVHSLKARAKSAELQARAGIARDPVMSALPPEVQEMLIAGNAAAGLFGYGVFEGGTFNPLKTIEKLPVVGDAVKEVDEFVSSGKEMVAAGKAQMDADASRTDLDEAQRWERALVAAMIPELRKQIISAATDGGAALGKALGSKIGGAAGKKIGMRLGLTGGAAAGAPAAGVGALIGGVGGAAAGAVAGHEIGEKIGGMIGEKLGKELGGRLGNFAGEALADRVEQIIRKELATNPMLGGRPR